MVSDKSYKGFVFKHLILKLSSEPIKNLFCTYIYVLNSYGMYLGW
ncbi:hypothetical protein V6Z11_A08G031000 [Gossypium hirsutum]